MKDRATVHKYESYFKGKKITLLGLGLLGRGVGDAQFLASCDADLIVTDLKSSDELAPSLEKLTSFSNIHYTLGEHKLEDFKDRNLIIHGPKVPLDSPFLSEAKKNNIPVTMSTALFAKLAGIPTVGITGTRGKTTTTYLIAQALLHEGRHVLLGGNIPNVSTLALLKEVTPQSIAVLELDSWQLQGFHEEKISPHISVFTTFFPDHMDYYRNNMDAYVKDKAAIFLYQNESDTLVVGEQAADIIKTSYGRDIRSQVVIARTGALPRSWQLKIPGEHNRYNAACALLALRTLGVEDATIQETFKSFPGVPGRLELVREIGDIKIYNDTTATTPEATIAGLRALGNSTKNIVLIMGGYDKGLAMSELIAEIPKYCKEVVLLAGTGTERVRSQLPEALVYDTLEGALGKAVALASAGDTVLFSPAFASFGMFNNEYDRGEQFCSMVKKLNHG